MNSSRPKVKLPAWRSARWWRSVLLLVLCVWPGLATALNNPVGTSDPSSADLDISFTIPTMFRIGGITDLTFGSYSGSGGLALDDDVCVWTNATGGSYRITAKGSGASFAFLVAKVGDTSKTIAYAVNWNNTSGTSGNQPLTANTTSSNISGANTVSTDCSSGPSSTANFQVTFSAGNLLAASSGTYTGTLSLVISAPV